MSGFTSRWGERSSDEFKRMDSLDDKGSQDEDKATERHVDDRSPAWVKEESLGTTCGKDILPVQSTSSPEGMSEMRHSVTERPDVAGSPSGVKEMERSDEGWLPGSTCGKGSGRDNSPLHSTKSPEGIPEIQLPMQKNSGEVGEEGTKPTQNTESTSVKDIQQNIREYLNSDEEDYSGEQHTTNWVVPPPDHLTVVSVDTTSATVNWKHPPGLDQTHHHYQISYHCPGTEPHTTTTSTTSITLSDLRPATEYSVTVCTVMENGVQSQPVPVTLITKVPAPSDFTIEEQKSTSFTIRWTKGSGLDQTPQYFLISYSSPGKQPTTEDTDDCYRTLSDLEPGTQYTVSVSTVLTSGQESDPVSTTIYTVVPPPVHLTIDSVDTTSATLNWRHPPGLDQTHHHYQISYHCPGTEPHTTTTSTTSITLSDLRPATGYSVTVFTVMGDENPAIKKPKSLISRWTLAPLKQVLQRFNIFHSDTKTEPSIGLPDLPSDSVSTVPTNRQESEHVSITICTAVPPPDHLTVDSVDTTSATVNWRHPPGLDQTHHHYQISYHCPGTEPHTTTTSTTSITLSDLRPVTEYSVTVWTVMEDEQLSEWVPTNFTTRSFLKELLSKTGLSDHFPNKLMLSKVLEINANTTSDEPLTTVQSLPGSFLKKLMMANVKARSSNSMSTDTNVSCRGIDSFDNVENDSDNVHPLDLITAA